MKNYGSEVRMNGQQGKEMPNGGGIQYGEEPARELWYKEPARVWEEALPLGNGRLGAMVFGGTDGERIQVNEESMWYGAPADRLNPDAAGALPRVRELIRRGKPAEAQKLMGTAMAGCPEGMHPYQTLGDIYLNFVHPGEIRDYRRSLNLEEACCQLHYRSKDTLYTREYFISAPADCMVMYFKAEGDGGITFTLRMDRGHFYDGVRKSCGGGIFLYGNLGEGGYRFAMLLRARVTGGRMDIVGETLQVEAAKEVALYFSADTTYHYNGEDSEKLSREECYDFLEERIGIRLKKAMEQKVNALRQEHVADYRSLYGRAVFRLTSGEAGEAAREKALSTKELLELAAAGKEEPELYLLLFDYGRYLLISCSREGGLPATLQGIWNKDFEPPWDSKYTININTQMNYWPAEICNLSECHMPLFALLEKMRERGRRTAREMYGCRGFTAHHNTDIHGDTQPQDLWYPATFWPMGAAWLCTHLWTHYIYTKEEPFLVRAFPILAEAALFFVDFLTEWKGYLVTNPSVSPENTYILPSGEQGCCCMGPSMDNQIIRDLFDCCLKAYDLLGEKAADCRIPGVGSMAELMVQIREKREKLAPIQIGGDGRIMEWLEEYGEAEPGHRHISHLYGLYPSGQITVDGTPELARAAMKTLEYRLSNGGGHTGWSRAWITNHYAKLWDGEKACESIRRMLADSIYPNLFDKHPPFQIDGNFGVCAAIANMLVQSDEERTVLLPALPKTWENGVIKGIRLVGNALIDISWQAGRLAGCRIQALSDYESCVKYKDRLWNVKLKKGEIFLTDAV